MKKTSRDLIKYRLVSFMHAPSPIILCSNSLYVCLMHRCIISCVFMQLEKLRPEFGAGLDAFTKFVFEKTRPKQLGGTVMTGPILVGITQSYLDALNNGAVPTITSSWQV